MIRRMFVAGGLAVVFVSLAVGPALADDLSDYLANADDAIYSGRRIIATTWDGVESAGVVEIQHYQGMTFVGTDPERAMIGGGRMHLGGSDESAVSFVRDAHPVVNDRYTVSLGADIDYLGRPARIFNVMEGDVLRMRTIIDESTSAPVATEVFGPDGEVFRYSAMIEFEVSADPGLGVVDGREYEMMLPIDGTDLPEDLAGYRLVDAYGGPGSSHQGFYSDGLFSFSVFTAHGRTNWGAAADNEIPLLIDGAAYLRVIAPASISVLWNTPDTAMALVGDLPPDHLEQVLEALPRPGSPAWFRRVWIRFFG